MSAGEFFDLIMPAVLALSALISTWVLASARQRLALPYALAFAVGTLFLPLIVFPLYLVLMLWCPKNGRPKRWPYALPLIYGAIVLSAIAAFFYSDRRSVDAHLARATRAKIRDDRNEVIREYRQALALEDDPHTHKLLAIELTNAGDFTEALSEFRLAQKGGEQDDSIYYRVGLLLDMFNQTAQANIEFQNFLASSACLQIDARCEDARKRLEEPQE